MRDACNEHVGQAVHDVVMTTSSSYLRSRLPRAGDETVGEEAPIWNCARPVTKLSFRRRTLVAVKANRESGPERPALAVIEPGGSGRVCAPPLLTGVAVATFRALVERVCAASDGAPVLLDLSRVVVISRPAALMLFECARRAERGGVRVVLLRPSAVVCERIEELSLSAAITSAGVLAPHASARTIGAGIACTPCDGVFPPT